MKVKGSKKEMSFSHRSVCFSNLNYSVEVSSTFKADSIPFLAQMGLSILCEMKKSEENENHF